jgi:uncharacterized membrane protein
MSGRYEDEEYLEQDDEEQEAAGRRKSLIALAVMAVLVVAGIVLIDKLRAVSDAQNCLMTRTIGCPDLNEPPVQANRP